MRAEDRAGVRAPLEPSNLAENWPPWGNKPQRGDGGTEHRKEQGMSPDGDTSGGDVTVSIVGLDAVWASGQ